MTFYTTSFPTPFGEFSAAVDEASNVIATAFGGLDALKSRLNASVGKRSPAATATMDTFVSDEKRTRQIRTQVLAYCRGERSAFDLPLRAAGTPFQQRVWSHLARIPRGKTRSYAEVALAIGSSPRAVGRANATNPICLIVPCHRVIGADGSLTGFAFGETLKQRLLDFERAP